MITWKACHLSAGDISRGLSGPGVITLGINMRETGGSLDAGRQAVMSEAADALMERRERRRVPMIVRLATAEDMPALQTLMAASISELQREFLTHAQIEASRMLMGLDAQLINDGTYFIVHIGTALAGCGGWSRRATLYGGSHSPGRDPALLDPATDAARVRAMYTHPAHARQGVGRVILRSCENAALAEGFSRVELAATLSGQPLYRACGYSDIEQFEDDRGGVPVPLVRMGKILRWRQ